MKPIIFVFGPSGVGKSYLSKMLEESKFLYVHIDTDRSSMRTFTANGFPSEWEDYHKIDFKKLESNLRNRLDDSHVGIIVSFPTEYVLSQKIFIEIKELGVTPLILWGTYENCVQAATKRIEKKGRKFNSDRYKKKNELAFRTYSCPEYDAFRLEAFREDGLRYPDEEWLALIMGRTTV